jgi:hypothetical protein
MTITLKPETEARLRNRAQRDGSDLNELADALLSNVLVDDPASMTKEEIEASYREMAADEEREAEALEWIEGTLGTSRK